MNRKQSGADEWRRAYLRANGPVGILDTNVVISSHLIGEDAARPSSSAPTARGRNGNGKNRFRRSKEQDKLAFQNMGNRSIPDNRRRPAISAQAMRR